MHVIKNAKVIIFVFRLLSIVKKDARSQIDTPSIPKIAVIVISDTLSLNMSLKL